MARKSMVDIITYIVEKLKINKDIKLSKSEYELTDEDFEMVYSVITDKRITTGLHYGDAFSETIKNIRSNKKLTKLWTALMLETKSIPYINENTIISSTCNLGKEIIDKLLKNGADKEEIMYSYEINKEKEINPKYQVSNLEDFYNDSVNQFVSKIADPKDYNIELLYDDIKNYSSKGIEHLNKRNGLIVLPFIVHYKKTSVKCELCFSFYHVYYYEMVEDINCGTISRFEQELANKLNIK